MTAFPIRIDSPRTTAFSSAGRRLAFVICALLAAAGAGLCQQASPADDLAAQVKTLNAGLSVPATLAPGRLAELLKTRASLLSQLMAADPARAAEVALPAGVAERLRASAPPDTIETAGEWTGTLGMVIGDDFEHHRSSTRWMLPTAERMYEIVSPDIPKSRNGASVKIRGVALGGRIAMQGLDDTPGGSGTAQACSTTGVQNIAVILVTMPSFPTLPPGYTMDALRQAFFGDPTESPGNTTLNGWWNEMSHGQISATGNVVGPFALSQDYACDQPSDLLTAALAAADSSVDFSKFTRVEVVFHGSTNCPYGGLSSVGCGSGLKSPSKTFTSSVEWLPFTSNSQTLWLQPVIHELGHGLGLSHANSDDYGSIPLGAPNVPGAITEYGDFYSTMGFGGGANQGQISAEHSLFLQWLHPGDYAEVSVPGTYTLAPYETNGLRALRILRDAGSDAWLWAEYRQPIGDVDSGLLDAYPASNVFAGALIRYADPTLDDPYQTYLLDFDPTAAPNDFMTAALTPGQTWSDPYSPLTLTVNSATPQGLSITVGYDSQCAALGFSSTSFASAGGAGTITVTAPAMCSWTASAAPGWIALSGATSGFGNGSISFTVAANGGTAQRSGSITVGRQSVTIAQGVETLTVEGMSPQSGSGPSGQLTFHFSDTAGAADISSVAVQVGPNVCSLTANPGGWVYMGSGSFRLPMAGASASSGSCTVHSDGSSITSSGSALTVTLNMSFGAPLNGAVRILAQANSAKNAPTGYIPVGGWTVPARGGCVYTLAPAGQSFGPAGGSGQVIVAAGEGCSWTAASSASWLTLSPSNPGGSGNGTVTFSVAANSAAALRNGFVMIGGQAFPVRQGGPFVISTLAGGEVPATQGQAAGASVPLTRGIVSDSAGNVYFSSQQLHTVFMVSAGGIVTRVAGTGVAGFSGDGGPALAAKLNQPQGLAIDASGNLFIADNANQRVRKMGPDGTITTVAGNGGCCYSGDNGPATSAQLGWPESVAVDASGSLFILDTNGLRVRKVDLSGKITTIAGNGTAGYSGDGGPATIAQLNYPNGIALDASGILYIADSDNNRIRKVAADGTITTVAGNGTGGSSGDGGLATQAQLSWPNGIAFDAAGNLYIADTNNNRVRKVSAAGYITTVAGNGSYDYAGDGGPATSAEMATPWGVTLDKSGNLYIADYGNQRIRKVSGGTIGTIAGSTFGDGAPAVFGRLNAPNAVAKDKNGNVYVADYGHHSIRKIAADGTITTLAGTGVSGYSGDGGPAANAQLNQPQGLAVDASGAVYIADGLNHRVRKVATNGTITTVVGTGCCYSGDGGLATQARINYPHGLFIDASGSLFLADSGNDRIRKVDTTGHITTVAGNGTRGLAGDGGPATAAQLSDPRAVAVDSIGDLYIADSGNHRIRKVDTKGIITTLAGTSCCGYSGDGGPAASAQLNWPTGVAVDSAGDVYIADTNNGRIRMVNPAGVINLVAGNGDWGWSYSGDGGAPTQTTVRNPAGMFLDPSGNLYVADQAYNKVRVLVSSGLQPILTMQSVHAGVFGAGHPGSYTVTVSNALFAGSTSGLVTFTAVVPAGMTVTGLSGSGWNCSATQCSRSDALAGGASYPPVTVTVAIAAAVWNQATPQFSVSGGGGMAAGVGDFTMITPAPAITAVVNAASFLPGIAGGSWVSVTGTNLSTTTRTWQSGDFVGGNLPAALDGVSATIGGKPAYVYYISPGQLNVLPPDLPPGPATVTVTTAGGATSAIATVSLFGPAFFLWPGSQPVATRQDYSLVAKTGSLSGAATVPAKPGEVIILWATGLGPTSPAPPAGVVTPGDRTYATPTLPAVTINNIPAVVYGAALASGAVGLYQIAIQVPTSLADGDWPIQASMGGVSSPAGTALTVHR